MTSRGSPSPLQRLRVVIAGGGIAGGEALLALGDLARERVDLTLVSPGPDLVYRPLSVAEPFALGHAKRYPLHELAGVVGATLVQGTLARVDEPAGEIELQDGRRIGFDALIVAVGARATASVEHATTWWPQGDPEAYGGVLRDLEEGYLRRLAFVVPPGAVWPLPVYELALMTARDAWGMGIDDAQLTVITPEAVPLALFGPEAAGALAQELQEAGVGLETATAARVVPSSGGVSALQVVLQPGVRRLDVDRVIAVPEVRGPDVPGLARDAAGFIPVDDHGRVRGSDRVWAAGDGIAYPVKYGGLAAQQADTVAAEVAALAGAEVLSAPLRPVLRGVLMTGAQPRVLGSERGADAERTPSFPIWRPEGKVQGTYLTPYLQQRDHPPAAPPGVQPEGVAVDEPLPGLHGDDSGHFHALWRPDQASEDFVGRLGERMHEYEARHRDAGELLRDKGKLGDRPAGGGAWA